MQFIHLIPFLVLLTGPLAIKLNVGDLRCLVCQKSLDELKAQVGQIDPRRTIEVGGYRLDKDGNMQQKTVSQAKSEIHLSELIDGVCGKMDDYVRATWKSSGALMLLKLIENGKMNDDMSEVDIVQDDDLNKSLKYYCEEIMETFEETIIKNIQSEVVDLHSKVCIEETKLCETLAKRPKDEL